LPRVKTVNSGSDNLLSREGEKSCLSLSKAESAFSSGLSFKICNQKRGVRGNSLDQPLALPVAQVAREAVNDHVQ
jgi:hypothetical protein